MMNIRDSYILLLICFLAVFLRICGLQLQSLSMDEAVEIKIARLSLQEIIFVKDGFPPLFHILLNRWLTILPDAESARWFSVIFGCLSIPLVWNLARQLSSNNAALWAALILTISPFHIWYCQEVRAYSLFYCEALAVLFFFFRALDDHHWQSWLLYGLSCLAGLYTHYYFIILIAICGVILLFEKQSWNDLKKIVLIHVIIGIFSLPILWLIAEDLNLQEHYIGRTPFTLTSFVYSYFSFFAGYALGPSKRALHSLAANKAIVQFLPWLLILGACLVYFSAQILKGQTSPVLRRRLLLLSCLPVLMCGLLSEFLDVGYKVRYVVWVSIPLYLWIAHGLSMSFDKRLGKFFFILLCSVFAISLYNRRTVGSYMTEDARGVASYIASRSNQSVPVYVIHNSVARPVAHYLGHDWPVYKIKNIGKRGKGLEKALTGLLSEQKTGSPFWLVYTRPFHGDPGGWFKETLSQKGVIRKQVEFSGIELFEGIFPMDKFFLKDNLQ